LRLIIARNGGDSDRLPSAHTCFNHLLIPEYSSEDKLRSRMMTALELAAEGNAFDRFDKLLIWLFYFLFLFFVLCSSMFLQVSECCNYWTDYQIATNKGRGDNCFTLVLVPARLKFVFIGVQK
jgi:hypothetical protein